MNINKFDFGFWFLVFGRKVRNGRFYSGKNVLMFHPVFKKLEFYLNLKNDFALTFIRDEHKGLFLFLGGKKRPQNVK